MTFAPSPSGSPWDASAATIRNSLHALRHALRQVERGIRRLRKSLRPNRHTLEKPAAYLHPFSRRAAEILAPRVLIIAETSIPQCTKYRVVQKQESFLHLGIPCTWLSWTDMIACRNAMQSHSHVIFYRVPAQEAVLDLINEAKRLGLYSWWEADDLIFDEGVLQDSRALKRLPRTTFEQLLKGATLYRRAMLACDGAIASTPGLADTMRQAGMRDVLLIENGLDKQTLKTAEVVRRTRKQAATDGAIRIVYGSGTDTHDVDFEEAAAALCRILDHFPNVRLRLIGPLSIPSVLSRHRGRIEQLPATDYETYLGLLGECDISIAPLEDFVFNDAKSNIKYLEASAVGLPSICSPRSAFAATITHGKDGFLCDSQGEWEEALARLVSDASLRRQVADAARETVMQTYEVTHLAERQVRALITDRHRTGQLTILSVNIFYAPRSFGGATVVAENMNILMHERPDVDVHVFTTVPEHVANAYSLHRYQTDGINVFGMGLPDATHEEAAGFENPQTVACFAEVLDAVQPDIVHFHCIQGIGVGTIDLCRTRGVPYAITLHDAWWLCGRQFMIDRHGHFCGQTVIDQTICGSCVDNHRHNIVRTSRARAALEGAHLLIAPSQYFADLHAANGFPRVRVNKNGVASSPSPRRVRRETPVRVGYVGGNTRIKGFHLVQKAFRELPDLPATLVLVDNTINLGFSSFGPKAIREIRNVKVVPAYNQKTMDEFFNDIDILLFPTQWKESFGLTVREAIIHGVWVIATDAGGVVEDIKPGENGTIVPFRDDGTALKAAVVDAVGRIECIQPGQPVDFDHSGIRTCEEQAAELVRLLKECLTTVHEEAA